MFRKLIYILTVLSCVHSLSAQSGEEVFNFLRYPMSVRANALGGYNISIIEPDVSLAFQNPGLLGAEMDKTVSLTYMNFLSAVNMGSAIFSKAQGTNGAWAVGVNYANYGNFKQTSVDNQLEGEFSVGDFSLNMLYAHNLSEHWRGGLSLKFLYSSLERYTSIGLAADAGLSYYSPETGFSAGITLKNVGAQLKSYYEERYPLPWDVQTGFSKRLAHAPFRLSLTAIHLNHWDITFFEHLAGGVDFIPSDNFWLGIGYNPVNAHEMKLESGNGLGGFSAGGGVKVRTFDVGFSVARYHPSALSFMFGVSMSY